MSKNYELLEYEKRSIVDINYPIYKYIYELVYICLGFQSHFVGSHYIIELIENIIQDNIYLYSLSPTKDIYPMISEKFKTHPSKVERAIRYSCAYAWETIDKDVKKILFPNNNQQVPTNSEMISAIYEYVKGHYIFEEDYLIKTVYYKNGETREETENYINYKIRFEIKKLLYQTYNLNCRSFRQMHILIDAIMMSLKMDEITEEKIDYILKQLNNTYDLYEGEGYDYKDNLVVVNEAGDILLKLCKRLYEHSNETFSLQKPKNKTYIKNYMNILSTQTKNNLPFYI